MVERPPWIAFYATILVAWLILYAMQIPADLRATATYYGAEFWAALCLVPPGLAGFPTVFLMWVLMAAAMMAPGFVPALSTYDDLTKGAGFGSFALGYALVWIGVAVLASLAQIGLSSLGMITPDGIALTPWLIAALLGIAGGYQFSALKDACLTRCRAPLAFFLSHWREGPGAGVQLGMRHGADCVGCCCALMALGLVGGGVSLIFMGLATLLMAIEKLPEPGRYLTRPLGILLLCAAAATAVSAV